MKKRVADIVVDCLIENGITDCFSVVGGGAMHLNNAFVMRDDIRKVYCHHEQACAMAAEGYARASGRIAAVCVTSGPGGTNAINGVQGAYVDSIPMIVISGHPRYETTVQYTGLNLRCRGVQENDIVYMVKKITKYAKFMTDASDIKREINKAIDIAMDGRRGPVWIDIPLDIQGMLIEENDLKPVEALEEKAVNSEMISESLKILREAQRPCILTGSGVRTGNAISEFKEFCNIVRVPIVGGALQADICYNGQKLYYGMSGSMGPRTGNFILQNADVILVLGNSLSFKQTGFNQKLFAPDAKIIMVDTDEDESNKDGLHVGMFIHADLKKYLKVATEFNVEIDAKQEWINYCDKLKNHFPKYEALKRLGKIDSSERVPVLLFWEKFLKDCPDDSIISLGNSSCVHGVLQEGIDSENQRVLVNYNCGSMGHDLPQSIGAAIAMGKPVCCVTGDGSVMMNLQELQTIKHYGLPIKIVIFENDGYGAIRNTCSNFFKGVYTGCDEKSGISFPDFGNVAMTFGLPYNKCSEVGALDDALRWLWKQKGNCILEISQKINEIKGPKLESRMMEDGTFATPALHDMSPFLEEEEIEKLMWK